MQKWYVQYSIVKLVCVTFLEMIENHYMNHCQKQIQIHIPTESAGVKQENQQNASSTQATVIPKDKTAELTVVDMTDGETISTKTSMESLDDALNENNSNNTRTEGQWDCENCPCLVDWGMICIP